MKRARRCCGSLYLTPAGSCCHVLSDLANLCYRRYHPHFLAASRLHSLYHRHECPQKALMELLLRWGAIALSHGSHGSVAQALRTARPVLR